MWLRVDVLRATPRAAGPRVRVLVAAAMAITAGAVMAACAGGVPTARTGGADRAGAADFRDVVVRDTEGRTTTLRAAITGKPALVSFWAPWCEPCVKEQPDLERLARAAAACGGTVVGVAVGETPQVIATFAHSRGLTFRQLTDEGFDLADAIGQRRIPATMVIDGAARVVFTGEALDAPATAALGRVMPTGAGGVPCALR
jgi:thiol-disulfide isomerase/thioredoxin